MKKILFSLFLLLIGHSAEAQQWKPIAGKEKYNYLLNRTYSTIWVDSTKLINSDSVFFLNKILKSIKTNPLPYENAYLDNQSQFLLSKIIYTASQGILMVENDSIHFLIKPYANLNDTWVFDSLKNDTAKIINVSIMPVFGVMDSIKIITVSSTDTLILSKNNGILKFPLRDKLHQHYQLVGIEGRNKGVIIPTYKDVFDFKVGDVFYYYLNNVSRSSFGEGYQKVFIKSKEIKGDTITYHSILDTYEAYNGTGGHDTIIKNDPDHVMTYYQPANGILTKYTGQILQDGPYLGDYFKPALVFNEDNTPFKGIARTYARNPFCLPHHDTIFQALGLCGNDADSNIYVPNFGNIYSFHYFYFAPKESYSVLNINKLIGCIRDGKVIGEIVPDSKFISVAELTDPELGFKLYPNPATSVFTIEKDIKVRNAGLQLFDVNGRMLMEGQLTETKTAIDISNFAKGIYILKVITDHAVGVEKIIKE
jgi:hypothetical protein